MNNSLLEIDFEVPIEDKAKLRFRETELIKIVEAITKVGESQEWAILKEKIFDGVVDSLRRERETEIEKQPLNGPKIHNLYGQIKWAKKYLDLLSLGIIYKQELVNIRKRINAT